MEECANFFAAPTCRVAVSVYREHESVSAIETFIVSGYTVRPAGTKHIDHRLAFEWTKADPYHCKMDPKFWTDQDRRIDSWVLEDRHGMLLFFKLEGHGPNPFRSDSVQLFIQFPPANAQSGPERKHRILRLRDGMKCIFPWLLRVLEQNTVKEVFFDSQSEMLIRFCVNELGFTQRGKRLSKKIRPGKAR